MQNWLHNLFLGEVYSLSALAETAPDSFRESDVVQALGEGNSPVSIKDNCARRMMDSTDAGVHLANLGHADIFKASPIAMATLDASQKIININLAFCRLFELEEQSVYGKHINILASRVQPSLNLNFLRSDTHNIQKLLKRDGSSSYIAVIHQQIQHNTDFFVASVVYIVDIKNFIELDFLKKGEVGDLLKNNLDLSIKNQMLKKQSMTDYLTGLSNRRALHMELRKEIDRVDRFAGNGLSLLLIDVDFFKKYNDTFGHLEGDRVLQAVASSLQSSSRSYDCISRYGGEEFAVILPNTDLRAAFHVAERMRSDIEKISFGGQNVTISIGIGFWSKGMSEEALINDADSALYTAKQNGRNTVFPKIKANQREKKITQNNLP
jgi:diguanylate cyclase (GGDEF)-like protein/PAS domain S-box-containing protein